MQIQYVRHEQIDFSAWDACVKNSFNALPYAESWYLNIVAPRWDALVMNNYEAVMPLPWNQKIPGYPQVFQPPLCQQLGVFSRIMLTAVDYELFLNAIPKRFKRVFFSLNENNFLTEVPSFSTKENPNLVLPLNSDYSTLYEGFRSNLKRNLLKGKVAGLKINANVDIDWFISQIKKYHQSHGSNIDPKVYPLAKSLVNAALLRDMGQLLMATTSEGAPLAAIFLLKTEHRLIDLLNVSLDKGRELGAMPFLINDIILKNAGKDILLDFEGSAIPGVARFYQSFGAKARKYDTITRDEYPSWLKLILQKIKGTE